RAAAGGAPAPILELARPTMTTLATKAKFLLAPTAAVALCVGLLAAGSSTSRVDPPSPTPTPRAATLADPKLADPKPADPKSALVAPDMVGAGEPGTVAGRVVGPDGKPVANATVIWRQKPSRTGDALYADPAELYAAPVTGKTDADGKFRLDV